MPSNVTLTATLEWLDEDGDGEECAVCGDRCYLTARNCYLSVSGRRMDAPVLSLCGSCKDEAKAI